MRCCFSCFCRNNAATQDEPDSQSGDPKRPKRKSKKGDETPAKRMTRSQTGHASGAPADAEVAADAGVVASGSGAAKPKGKSGPRKKK